MDTWPEMGVVTRFDEETEDEFRSRKTRIREILYTFRHRYYTAREGIALERELDRLESRPSRRGWARRAAQAS